MRCALQLYSLREAAARDLRGTLAAVARLGLDDVELAGLHGHAPATVRGWLDETGLGIAGSFVDIAAYEADPDGEHAACAALGCARIVVPWLPPTRDPAQARGHVARLARFAERAADAGLRPGFHTHDAELLPASDGAVLLELLLEAAPALEIELDLGWAWAAGRDPAALLGELGRRCPVAHVKDFADRDDPTSFTAVGEGAVPFAPALAAAPWLEAIVAEQDAGFVPDELGAATRSAAALLALAGRVA